MEYMSVVLPKSVENLNLPDPQLTNYYKDLENRSFWIDGEVDDFLNELIKYIISWNKEDLGTPTEARKPIKLFFFSPGGSLDMYRALTDIIKLSETPVWGIVIGTAYSAAGMIYLSCHVKLMLKSSSILFHHGSANLSGSFSEVYAAMLEYQDQVREISQVICDASTYTEEEVEECMNGDWYIRPQEAVEHGICDRIVENISELF